MDVKPGKLEFTDAEFFQVRQEAEAFYKNVGRSEERRVGKECRL